MGSRLSAPGPQEKRFTAYMDSLANAAGHEDRRLPLKSYCKGLLLASIEAGVVPIVVARMVERTNDGLTRSIIGRMDWIQLGSANRIHSVVREIECVHTAEPDDIGSAQQLGAQPHCCSYTASETPDSLACRPPLQLSSR